MAEGTNAFATAGKGATPNKAGLMSKLYTLLYGDENVNSFIKRNPGMDTKNVNTLIGGIDPTKMWSTKPVVDGMTNTGIGTTGTLALNLIKDNPLKTAGLGLGLGANIAGLFDNSQVGGQALGLLGGYAVPTLLNKFANANIGGFGKAAWTLGGGFAGSLFDKLIAKKKEEEALRQQYQGGTY